MGSSPTPGPSGRLGSFAISGIPEAAWQVHANRSAQIEAAAGRDASYEARSVAARATRDRKAHEVVEELVPRWRQELALVGYPPLELAAEVERAGLEYRRPSRDIVEDVAGELLSREGKLASEKTFSRRDVIVAVAPHLHGLRVSVLDEAVQHVLGHEQAIALPLVRGAREPVFAAACVIEDERRIAHLADLLVERPGSAISRDAAAAAVLNTELSRGFRLSEDRPRSPKGL